ncbi:hydroxymethylbilane synthase [uncultured Paenibacillus sp.]|uniref:hydroxymethylbilane synthase n=1 Tax=uncultured Paenibacillus sp. TaxID=227322 RepID=UPI0028D370FB|nr:hydroxymethylbilane synthase [uncultured Paenibacillus sp.]
MNDRRPERTIVVGTRQSALALTQTGQVIEALERIAAEQNLPYRFEIRKIVTKGDRILDVTLSKVGGKGLFVKEIEQALKGGDIDLAVHSMKDVPHALQEGLMIGAVPKRVDPRDALIASRARSIAELPQGAKVGTSSLRRACQLKRLRPDLRLESIRGNIDSRIRKLETEGFDAIILAMAGLTRMGWEDRASAPIPAEDCVPAVGQGALGIECRESDVEVRRLLDLYNDGDTALAVEAERSFLGALDGGCQVPIGAYGTVRGGEVTLTGMVGSPDGETLLKETMAGTDAAALGRRLAEALSARGADRILAEARG